MIDRFPNNPLIVPEHVKASRPDFEVLCAFNPGATLFNGRKLLLVRIAERPIQEEGYLSTVITDGETGELKILRFRLDDPELDASDPRVFRYRDVNYLTSLSHFRTATSEDGRNFTIGQEPTLTGSGVYETYGIEDARIAKFEDAYYVSYAAVSALGVVTSLARTRDFRTFEKLGVIFGPDNKDVAIFPEKIGGRHYTLHRPAVKHLGNLAIWLASSENLLDWGRHQAIIGPRPGKWDCQRVGGGAPPIRTPKGWLELYHGCDETTRYCTGALLLDLEQPWKVVRRSEEPFLVPEALYEREGLLPNIVFHNGLIDNGDGTLDLYYGGGDRLTCGCQVSIQDILNTLK
jgi:beta-1,2-mannobiose phosphorylase / 1,2-beta-oligomannan phosphorylase